MTADPYAQRGHDDANEPLCTAEELTISLCDHPAMFAPTQPRTQFMRLPAYELQEITD